MDELLIISKQNEIDVTSFLEKEEIVLPGRMLRKMKERSFYSELKLYQALQELMAEYTSQFLFPHHYVAFYPQVSERNASSRMTCQLSGAPIRRGESYYCYWPFIEDLNSGKVYTTSKKIKSSLGYQDYFPSTLAEYEDWYYKLKNAYYMDSDVIDFYSLSVECGDTALDLVELKKKKYRKENNTSKTTQ